MPCPGCPKVKADNHPVMPSLGKLAWNFMGSMRRLVLEGAGHAPVEEVQRRLKICESCELRVDNRCSHPDCGCYLDMIPLSVPLIGGAPGRAQYENMDCPIGKWKL